MLDFSMLLINTNRSKAYLQNLIRDDVYPKEVLVLQESSQILPEQRSFYKLDLQDTKQVLIKEADGISESFNEKEHIITTLKKNNIAYRTINTLDVNSSEVVDWVNKVPTDYIIYSGPGGCILREEILLQGKKFIHVHSGWLPEYRGSTTMYYSMLIDSNISCTVMLMNKGIDTGMILYRKTFDINKAYEDYDLVFDPIARASTLIEFLKTITGKADFDKGLPQGEEGNTFYIIHPVLKHLSILKDKRN